MGVAASGASATAVNDGQKVDLCHATSSNTNPYNLINVSVNSVLKHEGHDSHANDVIPPFVYDGGSYPGKNWTGPVSQKVIDSGCFRLSIVKMGPEAADAGDTLEYSIAVKNTGFLPIPFASIVVSDPSAPNLVPPADQTPLKPGETRYWTTSAVASAAYCGTVQTNVASVSFASKHDDSSSVSQHSVVTPPPSDSTTSEWPTEISCPTDLGIVKSGPETIGPGGVIKYTIDVTNNGKLPVPFDQIVVTDPNADQGSLTPPEKQTPLDPGETRSWTATQTAPSGSESCGAVVPNTATVGLGGELARYTDTNGENNSSTISTTVVCPVQVSIAKATGQATIEPGGTVSYTVGVTNTGTYAIPESAIQVDDPTATLGAPDSTGPLAAGATRTWPASKSVDADVATCGTSVTNTASVFLSGLPTGYSDTGAGDRSASASAVLVAGGICTPPPPPETPISPQDATPPVAFRPAAGVLDLVKTGPKASLAGGSVTFQITVTNSGAGDLTGVIIRDKPPASMLLLRKRTNGATVQNGRVLWNIGTLAAGQSVTKEVPVTLLRTARGKVCNTATAVADGTDTVRARACTTVTVGRRPATPVTG